MSVFICIYVGGKTEKIKRERGWCSQCGETADDCSALLAKQILHIQITLQSDYFNEMLKRI